VNEVYDRYCNAQRESTLLKSFKVLIDFGLNFNCLTCTAL
jgi:hypothetical protein